MKPGLGIVISIGKWGGVYIVKGQGLRIALGWIAITIYPFDGDEILRAAMRPQRIDKATHDRTKHMTTDEVVK